MDKLLRLNNPSNIKSEDMYEFSLNFHPLKFPPFSSVNLALAFSPPSPRWFIYGSDIEVLRNEILKPGETLKHNLHSFKVHLHVDIEHVKVLTLIHEDGGGKPMTL